MSLYIMEIQITVGTYEKRCFHYPKKRLRLRSDIFHYGITNDTFIFLKNTWKFAIINCKNYMRHHLISKRYIELKQVPIVNLNS